MNATFQELHIDQLVIHAKNVRNDVGIVTDLANSITEQGILQPLVVAPAIAGEGYTIIAGHRRYAAAKLANVDSLPCVIREDLDTEPKQLVAMLVENTQRADLTPVEEASAYQTILEFGDAFNVKTVAKATGRSQSHVRKRLLLTKLNEDAKVRLEEQTLNVDQALVLVDFAADEAATERLLAAAAQSPREFAFRVEAETRKRDLPGKLAALESELKEAGAKYVPESELYSGKYTKIYENEDNELTTAQHVAAGDLASIDRNWGRLSWYSKPSKAAKAKVELTEEEQEAKRRDAELSAALDIAHAIRAEHIKQVIASPPEGAADEALYRLLVRQLHSHVNLFAEITGRHPDSESDHQGIKAALADMTVEQMALLLHLAERSQEDELLKLWAWDAGDYRHSWYGGPKAWIEDLGSVYHYELSAVEQEVLDHFQQLHDARLAEVAAEELEEGEDDDA
ncbi:ParB/RepB/Spo0J family partition protein [Pseudarthrobacter sp. NIBRBAC000502770]|uniref:ParB/RepB/Spo0J family partition protein n=1 Tax=Pseudarthrobacter sp. NIBRBAC000502770 TaxID=2590785 RepID=UPI00113FF597|nr:ParB/RepB/Spo0J family partition protein [Pseudarthrobacter sp. NIBRBAC000502770]QDG88846.1 ParB/RepB/Spo0J family partition protein [Pseudarthrobacter sp. NIBRBAC000502770]